MFYKTKKNSKIEGKIIPYLIENNLFPLRKYSRNTNYKNNTNNYQDHYFSDIYILFRHGSFVFIDPLFF